MYIYILYIILCTFVVYMHKFYAISTLSMSTYPWKCQGLAKTWHQFGGGFLPFMVDNIYVRLAQGKVNSPGIVSAMSYTPFPN